MKYCKLYYKYYAMYLRETCPSSHLCGRQFKTVDSETGPYAYLLNIRIALFYRYNYVYLIPKIFFVSIECIRGRPAPLYINAVDNLEL